MGDFDNDGAMMDVDETLMCKFIKVKCENKRPAGAINGLGRGKATLGGGFGRGGMGRGRGRGRGAYGY